MFCTDDRFYAAGESACMEGKAVNACPSELNGTERKRWLQGFRDMVAAMKDLEAA